MTAPDPGLTDLIAAALGDKIMHTNGSGDRNRAYAAHVALVVEQYTNGRITEANARASARVKAANKRASIRITQIRKDEAARFEAEARAAKAEATIARVEKLQGDLFQQGGNLIAQWGAARLIRAALQEEFIRAAVEGES